MAPTITVEPSISPFNSVSFCFISFQPLFLQVFSLPLLLSFLPFGFPQHCLMRGRSSFKVKVLIAQWCLTFCDPMDSSMGSSVHGTLQARILEWVAISFSRGSSQPRDQTKVSCIARRFFTIWAARQVPSSLRLFSFLLSDFLQAFCFLVSAW